MDREMIETQWTSLSAALQSDFPHMQIPDVVPQGALWDGLIDRLAETHHLTRSEALDTLKDRCLGLMLTDARAEAA